MSIRLLVCGTRKKGYEQLVHDKLDQMIRNKRAIYPGWNFECIIEGCCPDSADSYAETWAKKNDINIVHFPSSDNRYLKRNIEMVKKSNLVMAFWDGYSYGTAQTIAQASMRNVPCVIYFLNKKINKEREILNG